MSETSEEKTKRKFIDNLTQHHWEIQYSIFFNNFQDSLNIIEVSNKIKRKLSKSNRYSVTAFLVKLSLKLLHPKRIEGMSGTKSQPVPYITIFSSTELEKDQFLKDIDLAVMPLGLYVDNGNDAGIRVVSKTMTPDKLQSYANAVNNGKPHNLKGVLGVDKVNRYSVVNKTSMISVSG